MVEASFFCGRWVYAVLVYFDLLVCYLYPRFLDSFFPFIGGYGAVF